MSVSPELATEVTRIVDQLQREHDGDPWHGSPLMAILEGIDAGRAAARPIADGHSIWELVLHMTSWKNETARRLRGAVACMPIEGDWPEAGAPTPERWHAAVDALQASHEDLIAAVRALPDAKLYEHVKYWYDTQAWLPKNALLVNKKAFDTLDKPTQDAVLKAAADAKSGPLRVVGKTAGTAPLERTATFESTQGDAKFAHRDVWLSVSE